MLLQVFFSVCDFYFKSGQLQLFEGQFALWDALPFSFQDTHVAGNAKHFCELSQTKAFLDQNIID